MAIIKPNNNTLSSITALPAAIPTGKVLQVVQTVKTDTFSSSSTSYTDITGMSVAITPSSSSNKILILCHLGILGTTGGGTSASVQLLRGSTVIGNGTPASSRLGSIYRSAGGVNGDHNNGGSFQFLDSPSTTSATTYKLQGISQTSFSFTVNKSGVDADVALSYGTRTSSTLTAMEISV
jgi:hypothetical protein